MRRNEESMKEENVNETEKLIKMNVIDGWMTGQRSMNECMKEHRQTEGEMEG